MNAIQDYDVQTVPIIFIYDGVVQLAAVSPDYEMNYDRTVADIEIIKRHIIL